MKKTYLVTGGCGFIGSHLVDRLIELGRVRVYDNLSSGKEDYVAAHRNKKDFEFIRADLLDPDRLKKAAKGVEAVFHLAANPEIRLGQTNPEVDYRQGIEATYNVLEAMRCNKIKKIVFSSSSTVFGQPFVRPTPEDYAPMRPISIYGAGKMACEGFISAYCHMFDMQSWIFRFANIVGKRATHGILFDFLKKLGANRGSLEVLGNGRQRKSYLLAEDCVDGLLYAFSKAKEQVNLFNLGAQDDVRVSEIARILLRKGGFKETVIRYSGGECGWRGDVPLMLLDVSKMKRLGWKAGYSSAEAIERAVGYLLEGRARPAPGIPRSNSPRRFSG